MHSNVRLIDSTSSSPMLAVPRWLDTARLPNDAIVVSELKITARGVVVENAAAPECSSRARDTR